MTDILQVAQVSTLDELKAALADMESSVRMLDESRTVRPSMVGVLDNRTGNVLTLRLRQMKLTDGSVVYDILVGLGA